MKKCQLGTLPQFNFRPVGLPPFLLNLWRKIYSWILKGALTLRGSIPTRYYLWRAFLTITFVNNAPWNLSALGYLIFIVLTSKSTIFFFKKFVFGPETQYKRCQRQQINFLLKNCLQCKYLLKILVVKRKDILQWNLCQLHNM